MTSHSTPRCTPLRSSLPKDVRRKRELGQGALTGGCGIFRLGFSFGPLFPSFTPNQVYDVQRPCPDPERQNIWPRERQDQPGLRESSAIHTTGGQGPLCWAGEWSPPQGMQPSRPGLGHPQNPARPRTSLRGASARRPPRSVGVPSSQPRVGRGTPAPAPWASDCCLGALVFPPLGQPHREKPRGTAAGGSCYGKHLFSTGLEFSTRFIF